jgi:hypothetical protein
MSVSILNSQIILLGNNLSFKNTFKKKPLKLNLLDLKNNSLGQNYLSEQTKITKNLKTLNAISETLSITDLTGKIIFIDVAREDRTIADKTIEKLSKVPSIEITRLNNQNDLTQVFQDLENKLRSCDVIITFYKQAPLNWIKERLRFYQVMQIHRDKPIRIVILSTVSQPSSIKLPKNTNWEMLTNE